MALKIQNQNVNIIQGSDKSYSIDYKGQNSDITSYVQEIETSDLALNEESFGYCLFKHRYGINDQTIFNVCYPKKGNSIGWIFPIRLLNYKIADLLPNILNLFSLEELNEKDNKSKKYFIGFMQLGLSFLVNDKLELSSSIPIPYQEEYKITDFYDEETYILLFEKVKVTDFECFIPYLYQAFDFCLIKQISDYQSIEIKASNSPSNFNAFDKLKLIPISSSLTNETYIKELYQTMLKIKLHPLMRFYLLYQVFELLMDKVGLERANELIDKLKNEIPSHQNSFYDANKWIKNSVQDLPDEAERINLIFNARCKLNDLSYTELNKELGKIVSISTNKNNLPYLLYELRNQLVHGYHKLITSQNDLESKLERVSFLLEQLITDIIINYP